MSLNIFIHVQTYFKTPFSFLLSSSPSSLPPSLPLTVRERRKREVDSQLYLLVQSSDGHDGPRRARLKLAAPYQSPVCVTGMSLPAAAFQHLLAGSWSSDSYPHIPIWGCEQLDQTLISTLSCGGAKIYITGKKKLRI